MKKIITFLRLVLILTFPLSLLAQPNMDSAVIKTIKINDHIHMLQWSGAGNMLLLSGKDGNILIDDQFAPLSEKINAAIQAISKGQVKFLFNTHYHGDHAGGNENFANLGATILAHENVRTRLMGDSTKLRFAKTPTVAPQKALPVMTFSEGMNVYLNTEDIIIFHVDNAHTDGDAVMYLPKSNVIHTGDCFMKDKFPFIDRNSGGSVKGWLSAVSRILAMIDDKTIVMPGHGDLANKQDYQNIRDVVSKLYESVKTHFKADKTLEQVLALHLTQPYAGNFGSGFIKGDVLITTMFNEIKEDFGWVELINGKDMSGWKVTSENSETWSFVDGMFQAAGKRSHLFYAGEYLKDGFKNFEIDVWVKTYKLANSGIYIHTQYQPSGWPSKGMEIQVNNSHIGEGNSIEYKKMASLYGVRNLYKAFGKDSVWMNVKAKVENNRVQIWLDGLKTVDYVQPENTPLNRRLSKGTFALQGHDVLSKMQYKSFKVRRLPDDARSDLVAPLYGVWLDSLKVWQNRQFPFADLNPPTNMSATELADYTYQSGINVALVKNPSEMVALSEAKNLPLFTGIKVNIHNLKELRTHDADYVLGESMDIKSAKILLSSGKINIWAYKGAALKTKEADALLDLAKQNNVAIEINNETKTPSVEILKLAKSKGLKFTFSGLAPAAKLDASTYIFNALNGAGLNYKDIYVPK